MQILLIWMLVGIVHGMHWSEKQYLQAKAKKMFFHGYHSYLQHAFPWDELKPLSCEGRRWDAKERGDLDDALGGYALTLIDSLDMLAIVGEKEEFVKAVNLVIQHVNFDRNVNVSVFETTIRVVGGLLSAHMLASKDFVGLMPEYNDELLHMAVDVSQRLQSAFDTPTRIPRHRTNLKYGVPKGTTAETCPAAAGSLLPEMALLSRFDNLSLNN